MDKKIARLVKDVPLFFGLRQVEIATFLNICKLTTWESGQTLCEYNASSSHLFVLLQGALEVVDSGELLLATVAPVSTVGEMGFISRRPRSATVRVAAPSQLLQVGHHDFEALLEGHAELRAKIYRNTIRVLADRLTDANDLLARYKKKEEAQSFGRENAEIYTDIEVEEDLPRPAVDAATTVPEGSDNADIAAAAASSLPQTKTERSMELVRSFYAQLKIDADPAQIDEDCAIAMQMQKDGYSDADLVYMIRWTARNIPSARRFNMVRLSSEEAFKDQWDI